MAVTDAMYLHKEFTDSYDLITGKSESFMKLSLSALQLQEGLIAELGSRNFTVLIALASFANQNNVSFPTLSQLAEITGISERTVIKAIQELETVKVGGKTLFKKTKVLTDSGNTKSIYTFIQETNATVEKVKPVDYIELFCKTFESQFGRPYVPNYGRDTNIIKNKLMAVFPAEDIPEIIRLSVTKYDKWSSNPQYPTPTIGALTWLANKAADELATQRKAEQQMVDRIAVAEKAEAVNPLEQLELL